MTQTVDYYKKKEGGNLNFTYELPDNFKKRVYQFLEQLRGTEVANAFNRCSYEYDDIGLAYYAGLKGDNWDKHAIDFIIEGTDSDIILLKNNIGFFKSAISKSLKSEVTGYLVKEITFFNQDDELPDAEGFSSNEERLNADIASAKEVYNDLVTVGGRLCSNTTYNQNSAENNINDFVRDALAFLGYNEVKDQTRHGISWNGADAGEVDILLTKEGKEIAIYEGLNLDSVDTNYINKHLNKAIVNYNSLGTATYIVAYVGSANFNSFWDRYTAYISNYEFPITVRSELEVLPYPNAAIRGATMIMSRDSYDFPVYFLAFNVRKESNSRHSRF